MDTTRVTEYTIVTAPSLNDLILAVKEHLDQGWEPQGGANGLGYNEIDDDVTWMFYQAMVR